MICLDVLQANDRGGKKSQSTSPDDDVQKTATTNKSSSKQLLRPTNSLKATIGDFLHFWFEIDYKRHISY